jgi:hypothetical protein
LRGSRTTAWSSCIRSCPCPLLAKGVGDDAEVIITGRGARQCVAALFSHQSFPGVRFGHRFTLGDKHAPIWLKEEIETGALHRMMQAQPAPDDAGIVWTTWGPTGASDP